MKWLLYLLIGLFFAFNVNAQERTTIHQQDQQTIENTDTQIVYPLSTESASESAIDASSIVIEPDVYAAPSGGQTDFNLYVNRNMQYPESAINERVQGRVMVMTTVGPDGRVLDAEVLNGVREDLDQEALRLVREMPNWSPAKVHGKPVATKAVVMVPFILDRNPDQFK